MHDEWMQAIFAGEGMVIAAPRGHAKAQSLNSKVLTPDGWSTIGSLSVGDKVIGSNGAPTAVIALHPISKMDLYKVSTRDGRSTLCNAEHLWTVETPSNTGNREITKETQELAQNYKAPRLDKRSGETYTEYRHFLPNPAPVDLPEQHLPVDPYTLGLWLGDGTSREGQLTTADPEILSYIPYPNTKSKSAQYRYQIKGLSKDLRKAEVLNNKHIPKAYLIGSITQRHALLQGLIDTDGTVAPDGKTFSFCNKDKNLIDGVVELVRSLGGTALVSSQQTRVNKYSTHWFQSYRVSCKLSKDINPARLSRKADRWQGSRTLKNAITAIEPYSAALGRCITVEAEDGRYITDDYLLTHNSMIFSVFLPLYLLLTKNNCTIALVGSSIKNIQKRRMTVIIRELKHNSMIIQDFGSILIGQGSVEGIVTTKNTKMTPYGIDTRYRGERPHWLILDDIENDINVRSKEQRDKITHQFSSEWFGSLHAKGTMIIAGTVLHPLGFISTLINTQYSDRVNWFRKLYRALETTKEGVEYSVWPEQYPTENLLMRRDVAPVAFQQEFQNNPLPDDMCHFKLEDIQYYDKLPTNLRFCTAVDPAKSLDPDADETVIITAGTDTESNIHVADITSDHLTTDRIVDEIYRHADTWHPNPLGIECDAYQHTLKWYLDTKRKEGGHTNFFVTELHSGNKLNAKERRILALQPFIKLGRIKFHSTDGTYTGCTQKGLVDQICNYPGRHDDRVDALSYILEMVTTPSETDTPSYPKDSLGEVKQRFVDKYHRERAAKLRKWHS